MASNPFKNVAAFRVERNVFNDLKKYSGGNLDAHLETFVAADPAGGAWRTMGLAPIGRELLVDIESSAFIMLVQFNERILPAKVRDEHLRKRVELLIELDGKCSKKEYAELRDEVEFELLPRAFIRRTLVHCMFIKDWLFVFSASQKKIDECCGVLKGAFETLSKFTPVPFNVNRDVGNALTAFVTTDIALGENLTLHNSAVLKGADKRTVRIRERDIAAHEVQSLAKQDYKVSELGLTFLDDGEPRLAFRLDDSLRMRGCTFADGTRMADGAGLSPGDRAAAFQSFAWIVALTYPQALLAVAAEMGGELNPEDEL
jgi:recombination associated protein RdgC